MVETVREQAERLYQQLLTDSLQSQRIMEQIMHNARLLYAWTNEPEEERALLERHNALVALFAERLRGAALDVIAERAKELERDITGSDECVSVHDYVVAKLTSNAKGNVVVPTERRGRSVVRDFPAVTPPPEGVAVTPHVVFLSFPMRKESADE